MTFEAVAATISALGALASGAFALLSHFHERRIRRELKADEQLLFGTPHNPSVVRSQEHRNSVLEIPVHNVSTTKRAFVKKLQAYNRKGEAVAISWSGGTDELGNVVDQGELLPIHGSADLYVRANSGEPIDFLTLKIFHTFAMTAETIIFDKYMTRGNKRE